MAKGIREVAVARDLEPSSLSELIHQQVRVAIEAAVHEELPAALGAAHYERSDVRRGYRNGTKTRTLTGRGGWSHSPCRARPCSPARRNGRRASFRGTTGECRR